MGRNKITPSKSKTLYVSDLDGTLLGEGSKLSQRSAEMLNEAIALGAHFTIATARTPATISTLLKDVDMRLPAISMTGAVMWNFENHDYSCPQFIPRELVCRLLEIYKRHSLPVFHYSLGDNQVEVRHIGNLSQLERQFAFDRDRSPFKRFFLDQQPTEQSLNRTLLFYSMQPTDIHQKVYDEIAMIDGLNPVFYHDIFGQEIALLEVFSASTSKAQAVRRLAQEVGADRIVVFGDNVNDLPMMKVSTHSVAVANAISQVCQQADEVIGRNTDDSVAQWILRDLTTQ